jgi:hypothetical protein
MCSRLEKIRAEPRPSKVDVKWHWGNGFCAFVAAENGGPRSYAAHATPQKYNLAELRREGDVFCAMCERLWAQRLMASRGRGSEVTEFVRNPEPLRSIAG